MKNDLNFAQKSTTWLKYQCRSVPDPAAIRESRTILNGLEIHQSLRVTPTKPTSTLSWVSFSSFLSFLSFDFGLIRYQNWGTSQYFGRNLGNEESTKYMLFKRTTHPTHSFETEVPLVKRLPPDGGSGRHQCQVVIQLRSGPGARHSKMIELPLHHLTTASQL